MDQSKLGKRYDIWFAVEKILTNNETENKETQNHPY